jgi:hypothetical protein
VSELPITLHTDSGHELRIIGPTHWSEQYWYVEFDGVMSVRPSSLLAPLLLTLAPHSKGGHSMARTKDQKDTGVDKVVDEVPTGTDSVVPDDERTMDDNVTEMTPDQNAEAVAEATNKSKPEPKESKEKLPSTAEVAAAWIVNSLESEGAQTKAQLAELAAKSNPAKFENPKGKDKAKVPRSTKWIVEHKKIGEMCPGNAGGHYISEGLDSSRNGGLQFVFADDKEKTLKVK